MIRAIFAACALAIVASCATNGTIAAPAHDSAIAQTPYAELLAMAPEQRPLTAYGHLVRRQFEEGSVVRPYCTAVRDAREVASPSSVRADGLYGSYQGAFVFTIQCGELTTAPLPLDQKWLVAFPPGAAEPTIEHCRGADGADRCPA